MSDSATVKERDFTPVLIEDEVRRSYLDYAMSVIVARALPDVRDGLKPVQRRILYAMREAGYTADKPYRKSARIVGDVMGKYHPHGGEAIYDTMVRMAQPFSMRLVLIDGQGNFGSMDGDPPAAMRYTEARLAQAASPLLEDIDADTVDFHDNYDGSAREPDVLPAAYPNLLINGAGGIAVGMATTIPPHNPGETLDAACALLDDPDLPDEGLRERLPGPDFPTGGIILGKAGISGVFAGGRGILSVRARAAIENLEEASPRRKPPAIIVTEIPYQVNKSRLIERIAAVAREKSVEGIADLRDESDRRGLRIVIEVKRGFSPTVLLNQLYRLTPLQTSIGVNLLALRQGRPCVLTIRQVLEAFIAFREEVVTRRTLHKLEKTRARAHTLAGLGIAVAHLDEVIALIRNAADAPAARADLCQRRWQADTMAPFIRLLDEPGHALDRDGAYILSRSQAQAILDLRLHRLTALERDKILDELQAAMDDIQACLAILSERAKLRAVLKDELRELRSRFTTPRRTEIAAAGEELDDEDLIQSENVVMTLSRAGYVKCSPRAAFRTQQRGGRGRSGMNTREQDVVTRVNYANTHTTLLFFTSHGKVYQLKAYRLPQAAPNARGRPLINILPLRHGETASAIMPLPKDALTPQPEKGGELFVMLATSGGNVRRNRLADFANLPTAGKIAMKLTKDESLIAAAAARAKDDVVLVTRKGRAIRFAVSEVRVFSGRESTGVRGMGLDEDDEVMTMAILRHTDFTLEEREAWLKRVTGASSQEGEADAPEEATELSEAQARAMEQEEEFLFTVTGEGYGKRASAYDYRITGRGGKGVAHIALSSNDKVAACFAVRRRDDIILATDRGYTIRCAAAAISLLRRPARGVRVVSLEEGDCVVSATPLIVGDAA